MKVITSLFLAAVGALSCEAAEPDRTIIPLPEPAFAGKIGETYKDSTAAWPKLPAPPAGAPNVVVIMLDDVGFGQTSTFGGPIPTPELDKLATEGLRYTRFHTTAICGPSRAALITGRNVHIFGALKLDMLFNNARPVAPGVPFFLAPDSLTGLNQNNVDIHARQTTLGAAFTGPEVGSLQSGGMLAGGYGSQEHPLIRDVAGQASKPADDDSVHARGQVGPGAGHQVDAVSP